MPAGSSGKFKKRVLTLTRTTTGSVVGTIGIGGQRYGKLNSFEARVTSSGATSQIEIKDSQTRVVYKDAADKDYQTATLNIIPVMDDTLTGLSFAPRDSQGVALSAGQVVPQQPILEGPLTVTWADADGAAGTLRVELYLEV